MKITLANLKDATLQEIFDHVARHLLTQKEKAMLESRCMYRILKEDGRVLKCAAGSLIADSEYSSIMDDSMATGWKDLVRIGTIPEFTSDNQDNLISELQNIHDFVHYTVDSWTKHLAIVAKYYGLSDKVLKEFTV